MKGQTFALAGGQSGNIQEAAAPELVLFDTGKKTFEPIIGPTFRKFPYGQVALRHLLQVEPGKIVASVTRGTSWAQIEGEMVEFDLNKSTSRVLSNASPHMSGELLSFDYANDGRMWISTPENNQLLVLNPDSREIEHALKFDVAVRSVRFDHDLQHMIIGTDQRFHAYDPITLKSVPAIENAWSVSKQFGHICSHSRLIKV